MYKKIYNIIKFPILLITLTLSIIAVMNAYPRYEELHFDYQGIIVAILSILVTILIGWNIFTVIDFKEKIQESLRRYDELNNKLDNAKQLAYDANITTNYALYNFYQNQRAFGGAIASLILTLSFMVECDLSENFRTGNINKVAQCLNKIIEEDIEFGQNNMRIIEKKITEIRNNKNYHFIKHLFESNFKQIESKIKAGQ